MAILLLFFTIMNIMTCTYRWHKGGARIIKVQLVIRDIQYSELIEQFIKKESIGISILKMAIRRCPPKLKNELVITYVNKNRPNLVNQGNKYLRKYDIPIHVVDMELKKSE